jgi:hypothetical protein
MLLIFLAKNNKKQWNSKAVPQLCSKAKGPKHIIEKATRYFHYLDTSILILIKVKLTSVIYARPGKLAGMGTPFRVLQNRTVRSSLHNLCSCTASRMWWAGFQHMGSAWRQLPGRTAGTLRLVGSRSTHRMDLHSRRQGPFCPTVYRCRRGMQNDWHP